MTQGYIIVKADIPGGPSYSLYRQSRYGEIPVILNEPKVRFVALAAKNPTPFFLEATTIPRERHEFGSPRELPVEPEVLKDLKQQYETHVRRDIARVRR